MRLSLHINPLAWMRQFGGIDRPDPLNGAALADLAGIDGIVCRLNESQNPITERDLKLLRIMVKSHLNVEVEANEALLHSVMELKPEQVTLVPPEATPAEDGLDVIAASTNLREAVGSLHAAGIDVSTLVRPDIAQIKEARRIETDFVTLNVRDYANAHTAQDAFVHLEEIESAALGATRLGLRVIVAHGLDQRNIVPLAAFDTIEEAVLDFELFARSVFVGIERAISEIRDSIRNRNAGT